MYCFLAIVAQQDVKRGRIVPSYVLCTHGRKASKFPWNVSRCNSKHEPAKLLVASTTGHDDMIQFMSGIRTRNFAHTNDPRKHKASMKYYPKGALFWFVCNAYGEPLGTAIYIKCVPDRKRVAREKALEAYDLSAPPISKRLSADAGMIDLRQSGVKPKLYQERVPQKGGYNAISL